MREPFVDWLSDLHTAIARYVPSREHRTVGEGGRSSRTVFGHLGYDVGHPGGAAGLGLQQTGKQRENTRLLDLHTGLGVWTGEMMSH